MEKILNELGFIDITKEHPIKFIECLPIGFDIVYPLKKRFKRVSNKVTTIISIGTEHNFIIGYGDSYYGNKWSRFHLTSTPDYFKEHLLLLLNANENKVLNL